jgi:hypothetical protein
MVTKTSRTGTTPVPKRVANPAVKRAAPRRAGSREAAAISQRAAPAAEPAAKTAPKPNLLRAGLNALGQVRDEVVNHPSRVFEAILGVDPKQSWPSLGRTAAGKAQEAFGLRKFEAVFDQRVAHAMERMGMPSVQAMQELITQVSALNEALRRLEASQRKR